MIWWESKTMKVMAGCRDSKLFNLKYFWGNPILLFGVSIMSFFVPCDAGGVNPHQDWFNNRRLNDLLKSIWTGISGAR